MGFESRQSWPARAVVTSGMPYGNKSLHFGHVAGVFVPADCYARFLRDRIGAENVLFVSGTDCYGSPIQEGYRHEVADGFQGTILDYVRRNHDRQKATLDAYDISLDIYQGSALDRAGQVHQEVTNRLLEKLHENGHLHRESTLQFYDVEAGQFLNGRQVKGYCPVEGCKSAKAYADECDLGHQFDPKDLIKPVSSLTGTTPELRPVENWYFDLPAFRQVLQEYNDQLASDDQIRPVVTKTVGEFLVPPVIFIKNELEPEYRAVADKLPAHTFHPAEGGKQSFSIEFSHISQRDIARDVLFSAGIKIRTGKALVPFRISGNVEWGVRVPIMEDVDGLTVWCWPESLWAPISFSATALEQRGGSLADVRDFWCSPDAKIYQFIGQDNLYFYGVAQPALWSALEEGNPMRPNPQPGQLQQSLLIANHHILFGKDKASSSGANKPPSADELLEHYTVDTLRAHWLALGLGQKSVGFKPKPWDPDPAKRTDPRVADPVLKEGTLLTNVLNRLARSCFYEAQKSFGGMMPLDTPDPQVISRAHQALADFEQAMYLTEFHTAQAAADEFIRWSNKWWTDGITQAQKLEDGEASRVRRQTLADSFYLLRVCALLMHPIAPRGCEMIAEYCNLPAQQMFSWSAGFEGNAELFGPEDVAASVSDLLPAGGHLCKELPPRTDFFKKFVAADTASAQNVAAAQDKTAGQDTSMS